jgi:hypothetical protein
MPSPEERHAMIAILREFPAALRETVGSLSEAQLTAKVDSDPWTIKQIVHHMADSHINSIIRLKLILTEDRPTLQAYDQDKWVTLPDVTLAPIEDTLLLLTGLHARWVLIWENLTDEQWSRVGIHTENGPMTPDDLLGVYANHCKDHLAQVKRILVQVA